jgi:N-acetylglucosaminyldiphosphoundecaprenol N-acetyl-beta-D-mannosaminyltransferase
MKNKLIEKKIDKWYFKDLRFDALSFKDTLNKIDKVIKEKKQIVLSTSNINWLVTALKDPFFKKAVLESEMSVIDGKPLLWIAKFLGFPGKETVAGSSLIQYLHSSQNKKPYTLFWFGGEEGVAEKASIKTNQTNLKCVGYYSPGFVSVEEMSKKNIINIINSVNPDLLLIALGAKKGVSWIKKNRKRLNARVISHVGATINFIAGDIKRAPRWMQKAGLEWLWRIKEEPKLWKRYFFDGLFLIKVLLRDVLPYKLFFIKNKNIYIKE